MATLDQDDLDAIEALIAATAVTLADAVTHGGTTARLVLGTNTADPALHITSGNGANAVKLESTDTEAFQISTSATGIRIDAVSNGITINGANTGLDITGGATGYGVHFHASANYGFAITTENNAGGVSITSSGTGDGVDISAAGSGDAISTENFVVGGQETIAKLDDTLEDDGGTYRFTTNALEQAPSGGSLTAQQVWEYAARTLTAAGLDSISTTAPSGVASNFREMVVSCWRRDFKKVDHDTGDGVIRTYADNGSTVLTTQTVTVSGDTTTVGAAT